MKCSLSLCSRLENLEQEVALLGKSACCSLAKQPAVVMVVAVGEERVVVAIGENEVVAAVSAALVATGNPHL